MDAYPMAQRVRLYSDIHLEFGDFRIPELPEDSETILVLAGDIGDYVSTYVLVEDCCDRFRDVVYVLGNHEYYGSEYYQVQAAWRNVERVIKNFHYLENQTVELGDLRFIGSTMWTDMNNSNPFTLWHVRQRMSDHRLIKIGDRNLVPEDIVNIHKESLDFIEKQLQNPFNGSTIVVTHHSPSRTLVAERFKGQELNYAFHADCDRLMYEYEPDFWFYGHTHDAMDTMIGNTRVMSNPRGYVKYENPELIGFDSTHFIDI
jgi:Icc-related predicted phosphoesterase